MLLLITVMLSLCQQKMNEWISLLVFLKQILLDQWLRLPSPPPSQWSTARCFVKTNYTGGLLLYIMIIKHHSGSLLCVNAAEGDFQLPQGFFLNWCQNLVWSPETVKSHHDDEIRNIRWNHVYQTCKQVKPGDSQDYNAIKNMWHIWLRFLLLLC